MTKNTIQPAETGVQREIPACVQVPVQSLPLRLSLTEGERRFLFELFCRFDTLLSQCINVLGFSDMRERMNIVCDLLKDLTQGFPVCELSLDERGVREVCTVIDNSALLLVGESCIYTFSDIETLCDSIRSKLSAAEPVDSQPAPKSWQQVLPFFSAPAAGPVESPASSPFESVPAEPELEPAPAEAVPVESSPAEPSPVASESELVGIDPPSPSVFDADAEAEAEAAGMPPLVSWDDFKKLDFRKLGARPDENTFRSERLGAIVHILQGKKDAPALQANADDVLEAACLLRQNYELLCDDYDRAMQLIYRLKDRLKEVLSSSGVKKASTKRRATGRTGRWYEALVEGGAA